MPEPSSSPEIDVTPMFPDTGDYDEILKTPVMMGKPEKADECNGKALDWVVEKATKEKRQLSFLLVCPADEDEQIHVKVFYAVKEMNADGTPVHQT
jgi:hypothetical protein